MVCTCLSGWSKVPARTCSRPCSGLFMRSCLPIPALAVLALALAGCEVQPVVSNPAPPPAVQTETPIAETPIAETPVTETPVAETSSETGGTADIPETASETEPEAAIQEPDTVADTEAAQDSPAAETGETSQPYSAEPVTTQAEPAATAEEPDELSGEVSGEVSEMAQAEAEEQAEQELPQSGDLAMATPPPPPPPELAPSSLIGSSVPMLQSKLGEADFTRSEGGVETWQYRFETCVVDYFLIVESGTTTVVSWAWRAPVIGAPIDEISCRRALAGRKAAS